MFSIVFIFVVSYRWYALPFPPVTDPSYSHIPYQRYGHTAVALGDLAYIWGGRNDTNGACDILFQYDTSRYFMSTI